MESRISRRSLIGGALACAFMPTPARYGTAYGETKLDPSQILDQPASIVTNRTFPPTLYEKRGGRGDFLGHYHRPNYNGRAGIDYAPIGKETEIVPAAAGIVIGNWTGRWASRIGGNMLVIHHGLGYVTMYHHLAKAFVKLRNKVNRNTVIALMGDTGSGGASVVHLHLDVYAPFFGGNLKFDHTQDFPVDDTISSLVLDAEEMSVLGRHQQLPFLLPEDLRLDDQFGQKVKDARREVDEYLKLFPNIKRDRFSSRVNNIIEKSKDVTDLALDRDIEDLYEEAKRVNDPRVISGLEKIMLTNTPRFTAPIKDETNPGFYDPTYLALR